MRANLILGAYTISLGMLVSCGSAGSTAVHNAPVSAPTEPPPFNIVSGLTLSVSHACVQLADGKVACWGWGENGELGFDVDRTQCTNYICRRPTVVPSLSEVGVVATGAFRTCVVERDGTVRCWGSNPPSPGVGLGIQTSTACVTEPLAVPGLTGVERVFMGDAQICAAMKDRTVRCWGYNGSGQLGTGDPRDHAEPVVIPALAGAWQLSLSSAHGCATMLDRSVQCWGSNEAGQLGYVSSEECEEGGLRYPCSRLPQRVPSIQCARQVAVAPRLSCAVTCDGTVQCWGAGDDPRFDPPSPEQCTEPGAATVFPCVHTAVTVGGLRGVSAVALGANHACALLADGTVQCWGKGAQGQLGVPPTQRGTGCGNKRGGAGNTCPAEFGPCRGSMVARDCVLEPVDVGLTRVVQIAVAGNDASYGGGRSCARVSDGRLFCWGGNRQGLLGDGTNVMQLVPELISIGPGAAIPNAIGRSGHRCFE